ncbi:NAD(P)H-dependent flavin oxidoreductase [Yinghuangia seranimata]|uniref:NAD(P)H-dependent flavin oxidoreductase n=1 Tax=Yinghuangia seranimata TaxID=408067 RepID=UPI00248B2E16|nr:nitronate monooxygenase [Yinghuangia seranimata]MDI2132764.1 nitronate monooxygenase [Yinghuangia seranimata]
MVNRVLAHTGARYPIIQAPMGWIARSDLAAAVSRAGGLGMIETSSGEVDACRAEIDAMVAAGLPFGVNLPLMFLRDESLVRYVADAGVRFVTTSAGSPARYLPLLKEHGLTVYHVVPSVRAARKAVEAGVDGLVVEGAEGGGFKNPDEVSLLVLLQAVRALTDLPLVAAGGIVDGRGMAAAFALGAEAVQMGTRFLSSAESPVHGNFKQAVVDADETGTVVVNRSGNATMRVLKTDFSTGLAATGGPAASSLAAIKRLYFDGEMDASLASAGQSAGLVDAVRPAADIIRDTMAGFRRALADAQARAGLLED